MRYSEFVERVEDRANFAGSDEAERAVEATLHGIAQALEPRVAREIAKHLPVPMAACFKHEEAPGVVGLESFYARTAARTGLPLARVIEHTQVVLAVLSDWLDPTLRDRLARELPDELAALLEPPDRPQAPPVPASVGRGRTLADGKPGSSQPLSEAAPGSEQPLSEAPGPSRSHTHSVAEPNPHARTKISSSSGLTQEREGETLSEGRSKRP